MVKWSKRNFIWPQKKGIYRVIYGTSQESEISEKTVWSFPKKPEKDP